MRNPVPKHRRAVQPEIHTRIQICTSPISINSTNLIAGDTPNGLQLERQLTIFRRTHAESHQFDVASVWRLESFEARKSGYVKASYLNVRSADNHLIVRLRSYSFCCTHEWNSTPSRRIHSSVTTGMMSCRPTTSLPWRHRSLTPSSTVGMPVPDEHNCTMTSLNDLLF